MIARGEFRNDAAVEPVYVILIRDGTGENFPDSRPLRLENRGGRVIA
jgi:hypothetical protein